jgi:hypothetical protein
MIESAANSMTAVMADGQKVGFVAMGKNRSVGRPPLKLLPHSKPGLWLGFPSTAISPSSLNNSTRASA